MSISRTTNRAKANCPPGLFPQRGVFELEPFLLLRYSGMQFGFERKRRRQLQAVRGARRRAVSHNRARGVRAIRSPPRPQSQAPGSKPRTGWSGPRPPFPPKFSPSPADNVHTERSCHRETCRSRHTGCSALHIPSFPAPLGLQRPPPQPCSGPPLRGERLPQAPGNRRM